MRRLSFLMKSSSCENAYLGLSGWILIAVVWLVGVLVLELSLNAIDPHDPDWFRYWWMR